ncbi:unnamed protein product, partial [marine sediment metagenome]
AWHEGDYTIRVEAKATGFLAELTTFAIESVEPFVEEEEEPGFWESQGPTITGAVIVLAVIAIAYVYMSQRKT